MATKIVRLKAKEGAMPGWQGFVGWLAETHPKLYNMARISDPDTMQALEQQRHSASVLSGPGTTLAGMGLIEPTATNVGTASDGAPGSAVNTSGGSALSSFVSMISQAGAALLPLYQQQKILNIQLKRAQNGQKPLDVGAYVDPNQGINVGMTPATQKTLLYLGGGLAGAWILTRFLKHR